MEIRRIASATRTSGRIARGVVLLALAALVAACGSSTPTASQASKVEAVTASLWTAATVEQPGEIQAQPSNAPTFCSPCHPIVGTYAQALVAFRGGYFAFGFDQPPAHAAAWKAGADAADWRRVATLPAPERSSIAAAVATTSGLVAAGTDGGRAAIWRSADGASWEVRKLAPPPDAGSTEQLTAIARLPGGGFAAGGYIQSAAAVRTATLWISPDGATWARASLPGADSAVVTGLAAASGSVVAVGYRGDDRRGTAMVWQSGDGGERWASLATPSLGGGRMLAVTTVGPGFVAVGERTDQTGAIAWYSDDGVRWQAAPDGPAFDNDGSEIVMESVAPSGAGAVAAGWRSDAGNGSVAVWRTADGRIWTRLPFDASFSGAGAATVLGTPRLLVGGSMGWPDTHAAQVWLAPK